MRIQIRAVGIDSSQALRAHTERRLRMALGRFVSKVSIATVRLQDMNGPRGGIDKRCRMLVTLTHGETVCVDEDGADLYTTVDLAADRVRRQVIRAIDRQRDPFLHGGMGPAETMDGISDLDRLEPRS